MFISSAISPLEKLANKSKSQLDRRTVERTAKVAKEKPIENHFRKLSWQPK